MPSILLIDDDRELTTMLVEYLVREGFGVSAVHDGRSGEAEALSGRFDIVVLDVMLPRVTGIEVLRRIRRESNIPVLLLTARGDDVDRISGLDLGADDYVPKPCSPGELVARLRAILRRTAASADGTAAQEPVRSGELVLWPGTRKASWHQNPLDLTGTEYGLLEVLARNAGNVVSKETLSLAALGRPLTAYDRRIDVHVSSIRHKLGPRADGQSWILGIRGQGYQLAKD
ncbi:winged helix family two component transcriptional regulator [Novosphingobium sp. Rr 2-17]|uniref:response regulator transcription factor n=1 Tax=Novosphingobium sp. Rr 2-17 TaxID=555793 RepID=UPI0002699EE2|nr:response regulator transcription factor [Novosphingobium sp. Rr 2-17]EIZ78830.1 winged helix family two component transcriptional regulator [Novosphingobium sp. Rr 2-17]